MPMIAKTRSGPARPKIGRMKKGATAGPMTVPRPKYEETSDRAWVRSSEYGLLTSLRPGLADSIAPTGLTSDNYAGLVFWDAETWMFPGVLAFHPRLARSIVDYRYRTRAAARANARRLGYPGLFYPWESGSTGDLATECQSWQPPHCLTQIHLQSDIALAVWQYYQATGDTAWTAEQFTHRKLGVPLAVGNSVMVGDFEGYLHFVARDSGKTLARMETDGSPIVTAPVLLDGIALVATSKGGLYAIKPQ